MADELKVDPVALHNWAATRCSNAVGEAALEFVSHEDGLAAAAPGWIGSSQLALGELAARWEAGTTITSWQVGGLGSHVAEAMVSYVTTEDDRPGRSGRCGRRRVAGRGPLTPSDVKRWDLNAIHGMFETASGRADTLQRLGG